MGVDAGEARAGLALGDDETRLALPLAIIERGRRSLDRVAGEIVVRARREGAEGFVVGLPLNIDGSEGFQARRARGLGRRLEVASTVPVIYWDERMSSFIAEQRADAMQAAGPGGRRRARHADDLAAAVILQAFLDARAVQATGDAP